MELSPSEFPGFGLRTADHFRPFQCSMSVDLQEPFRSCLHPTAQAFLREVAATPASESKCREPAAALRT